MLTPLFVSVVLFAIAGAFEFRQPATSTTAKVASTNPAEDHIVARQGAMPHPPSSPVQGPVAAKSGVMALAVVKRAASAAMPAPAAPAVTPSTATATADSPFDVAALTKLPLSDLILAALCKDPEGARRIFAQALLSTEQGLVLAPEPQTDGVPQPASERGSR